MPGKRCSGLNGERTVIGWVGLARGVVFEVRGAVNTRNEQLRSPERGRERSCCNSSNHSRREEGRSRKDIFGFLDVWVSSLPHNLNQKTAKQVEIFSKR